MDCMRVEEDDYNDHHEGGQLHEKGSFGFRPMHDQEEDLHDGKEQTSQSPPDTLSKGGNQEQNPADTVNEPARDNQYGSNEVHIHDRQLVSLVQQCQRRSDAPRGGPPIPRRGETS